MTRGGGWRLPLLLYLAGLLHWIGFLYLDVTPSGQERELVSIALRSPETLLKRPNFGMEDGVYIGDVWFVYERMLTALQQAVRSRQIPYHLPGLSGYEMMPTTASPVGDRLFGFPNGWPWSPEALLLAVLDLPTFVIVTWLIMYSVGFAGCLLIRRQYSLGPMAFTFLAVLFHLNGWITTHMTTKMPDNTGYYLSPYLVLLLLRAGEVAPTDRYAQRRLGLWIGLVMALMWWQGSCHPFIHWLTMLGFWGIVNWRKWRVTVVSVVSAFALAAFRVIPPALSWGMKHRYHVDNPAIMGFWSFDQYIDALAVCHPFIPDGGWEQFNCYVSVFGLWAILYLAFWAPWNGSRWVRLRPWQSLLIPSVILAVMSFRHMKSVLIPNWIPLFNAEAYTGRYMMIPLVVWIIVASINLQGAVEAFWSQRRLRWLMVSGLGVIAASLLNHSRLWRIWMATKFAHWGGYGPTLPARLANDMTDRLYINAVDLSLGISLVALVVVIALLVVPRKRQGVG
ncbi:MAG: hypothetical protein HYY59_07430 [Candidatus Omnitrophica bacterium]|nr:hypothetical protein [Candidatus Omnitrophota bacterium]